MPDIQSTSDVGETVVAGDGEMRARGRAINWAATALGPVEEWPEALRTTIRTILESFPINLWRGPAPIVVGGTLAAESTRGTGSSFTLALLRG